MDFWEDRKEESPDAPEDKDLYAEESALIGELSLEASIFKRISVLNTGALIHARQKQIPATMNGMIKNFFFLRQ